ncbi:hypothetical protein FM102_01945 [Corynebacterium glutamicum]|nr:hypothetical protein FM102_01945 [Corynebacterium glutamicum]
MQRLISSNKISLRFKAPFISGGFFIHVRPSWHIDCKWER